MILISAGHLSSAKGAVFKDFTEFPETLAWAMRINNILRSQDVPSLLVPPGSLTGKVRYINEVCRTHGCSLAVEIHFNANGKGGSETLYCPGSVKGKIAADIVQENLARVFPPNRGTKEGWHLQDRPGIVDYRGDVDGDEVLLYFLKATHCPAIILEPEFVHNKDLIVARREEACKVIAEALVEAREEICGHGKV